MTAVTPSPSERVTVTMPSDLVLAIDRCETNRSRFIALAVRNELQNRRRIALEQSLQEPHGEARASSSLGLCDWLENLPENDNELLDPRLGMKLEWTTDQGWQEAAQ